MTAENHQQKYNVVIGCGALNSRILVNSIFVLAGQLELAFTQRERFRSAKLLVLCVF